MSVSISISGADYNNDENGQFVQYKCLVDRQGEQLSTVARRFRDFKRFDENWRKLYPNIQIKLPPRVVFGRTSQKTVSERTVSLTEYLRNVAEIRSIRPLLAGFLGVQPGVLNELKPKFQQSKPISNGIGRGGPSISNGIGRGASGASVAGGFSGGSSIGAPSARPAPAGAIPIQQASPRGPGVGPSPMKKEICGNCDQEASGKFCQNCGYKLANKGGSSTSSSASGSSTVSGGAGRSFGTTNNSSPGAGPPPFGVAGRGGFGASRGAPPPVPGGRGAGGFGGASGARTPPLPGPKPNFLGNAAINRQQNSQSVPPLPSSPKPNPYTTGNSRRPAGSTNTGGGSDIMIVGDNFKNPEYHVMPGEFRGDIYEGRKMRRRKSFMITQTKDYLQIAQNVMVTRQFKQNNDHHCIFSDTALVYDTRFKSSKRVLMLTDTSIYLLSPGTLSSKLYMPISDVRSISLSTMADHFFVISSRTGKPDQMIMCPRKTEFLVALRFRTQRMGTQRNRLDMTCSDDVSVALKPNVVSVVMFRQNPNSFEESINLQVMNRGVVPGASISVGVPQNLLADVNRDLGEQSRAIQEAEEKKAMEQGSSSRGRNTSGVGSAIGGFVRGMHQRVNSLSRNSSDTRSTASAPASSQSNFRNNNNPSTSSGFNRSSSSPNGFGGGSNFSDTASVASSSFGGSTVSNFETLSVASYESEMNEDGKMMEPMTGNCLLDLYRGQKPHRRTSLTMNFQKYYLSPQIRTNLQTMISGNSPGENDILFGDTMFKINRRNQKQKRIILLTNGAVYVLQVSTQAIARRIALSTIERISVSKRGDHWMVIHVFSQHDLVMMCPRKTEFLIAAKKANPNLKIRCTNRIQYDLKTRDIMFILFGNYGGKSGDFDYAQNSRNKHELMVSFQFPPDQLATKEDLELLKNKKTS